MSYRGNIWLWKDRGMALSLRAILDGEKVLVGRMKGDFASAERLLILERKPRHLAHSTVQWSAPSAELATRCLKNSKDIYRLKRKSSTDLVRFQHLVILSQARHLLILAKSVQKSVGRITGIGEMVRQIKMKRFASHLSIKSGVAQSLSAMTGLASSVGHAVGNCTPTILRDLPTSPDLDLKLLMGAPCVSLAI